MLRICKDGKKKYQSLGISVLPRYWDFTRNKPKPNCPNKEYIQKIILDKQTELQQRMLEFNSEQKEYTTTTLLNDENKRFELKTVCQFYQEQIEQCKVLCKQKIRNSFLNPVSATGSERELLLLGEKCIVNAGRNLLRSGILCGGSPPL